MRKLDLRSDCIQSILYARRGKCQPLSYDSPVHRQRKRAKMTIQSAEALQESIRGGMIESGEYEKYASHAK
jgi:hypothetical protein